MYSKLSGERINGTGNLIKGKLIKEDRSEKWISNEGAAAVMKVRKGELYDKVLVSGKIEDIPYDLAIKLPHGTGQKIDFELDLGFNKHEIGDFYHDETKLNIYWELNQTKPEIVIDEPFGWTWQRADRPLHAANFTGLFENETGLIFQHSGTPKSWVSGNTYANVIAWGSWNFTNRFHYSWFGLDIYDRRLDRKCHYDYSITIAENKSIASIMRNISANITPLIGVRCDKKSAPKSLLTIKNENLVVTAVEEKEGMIKVRMYEVSGRESEVKFDTSLQFVSKTNVAGCISDNLKAKPFEIFELNFR